MSEIRSIFRIFENKPKYYASNTFVCSLYFALNELFYILWNTRNYYSCGRINATES